MAKKSKRPPKRAVPERTVESSSGRLTYRELRNTPGRVWERLSNDEPLTLVADGEAKAVVIPVQDGDVAAALEAYDRGRAMMSLRQIRDRARKDGTSKMTLDEINEVIRQVRSERRKRGER